MSLFAGIFGRKQRAGLRADDKGVIRESISRQRKHLEEYEDERLYLVKYDFGAFGDTAFRRDDPVAALTGEPFLEAEAGSRSADLHRLAEEIGAGKEPPLKDCRGCFSLCVYRGGEDPSVTLVSDRLGIRPIYYCCLPEFLYFSSSLRVLRAVPQVPKALDPRGAVEDAFHGYPLGNRTPYADVKRIRGGTVVRVDGKGLQREEYHRWSDAPRVEGDRDRYLESLHEVFLDAISIRSARDESALSFLSGGLDSRAVVGALRGLGKRVFTLTYERPGEMEGLIARKVAERLGTHHTSRPSEGTALQTLTTRAPDDFDFGHRTPPSAARLVFSGDGGSVGLGFVYMNEQRVQRLRSGDHLEVIENLGAYSQIPARSVFRRSYYHRFQDTIAEGVHEELVRERSDDPARDFHRFLMENDQRRHLDNLFEDVDRHRCEFALPFFDGRFLEMIAGAPVDWFLGHKLYNDWIQLFPDEVSAVAWQAYPGHEPCPVEPDGEIAAAQTQWEAITDTGENTRTREAYRTVRRQFFENPSAHGLVSPPRIGAALLLHGMGVRDYSQLWPKVKQLYELVDESEGKLAY